MHYRFWMTLILLLAAALRLVGLNNVSPPGLAHDEVAHWLINREIVAGHHAVYFTDAYGHEAGFHYIQVAFMLLLGEHALSLRLPSALAGLLLVAATFALTRQLFGLRVALTTAAFSAVLFWPVFYSRQAIRAIALPLMSALSAYFWWQGWRLVGSEKLAVKSEKLAVKSEKATSSFSLFTIHFSLFTSHYRLPHTSFLLAGLFAGLSLHMYMAGRAVPIFYGLFVVYLALFHGSELRQRWRGVLLFGLLFTAVAFPLLYYLAANPGAEFRISEVDAPLRALRAGDWGPVGRNTLAIVGMFGWRGDPLWRQNIAAFPVFDPITAVLFYIGVALTVWHWRQKRHLFLILWLFTAFIPSILTIDAPSSIRISNILPVLTIFPALVMHSFPRLSTAFQQLSTDFAPTARQRVVGILILLHIVWTTTALFYLWPRHPEVQFVWQKGLTDTAVYLDTLAPAVPVAVAGWTPDTMDPPTLELTLRRRDLALRYFDPARTLLIPAAPAGEAGYIARPTVLPLHPALAAYLAGWGALTQTVGAATIHRLPAAPVVQPGFPEQLLFGEELLFLGHDRLADCRPGAACPLVTFWRVNRTPGAARSLFLHLLDEQGEIAGQADGLEAPAIYWQPGDLILRYHELEIPAGASYRLRLGVYNPETGNRLPHDTGQEFILIALPGG